MNINSLAHALNIDNQKSTAKDDTTSDYRFSIAERATLSGQQTAETKAQEKKSELPAAIQKMLAQLELLKEQLEQAKEQHAKLQASENQQDDAVKTQIEIQLEIVMGLQNQVMSLSQAIADAMKEAGISDPGVLISALV